MNNKLKIIVCISGTGRSLQNMIEKQKEQGLPYSIVGVVSSRPGCGGEKIAKDNSIPLLTLSFNASTQAEDIVALKKFWRELKGDLFALAGFIKKFPLLPDWSQRVINIHPALLPKYGGKSMYGMNVHRAVYEAKEEFSGATIHKVTKEYDEGAIIAQSSVGISGCSPEEIAKKVFQKECEIYPEVLTKIAKGDIILESII